MAKALKFAVKSQTGTTHQANEDSVFSDDHLGLWIVADGMGGYKGGALASNIAVETISEQIKQGQPLTQSLNAAHQAIRQAVREDRGFKQMGTTVVALHLNDIAYEITWSGDSRAYLWNSKQRQLQRLSRDHSHVERLLAAGTLTPQEALTHPYRHVLTSCLGDANQKDPEIGRLQGSLTREAQVLLCSDGITDVLADQRIAELLQSHASIDRQVEALVDAAQTAGSDDDLSVIIVAAPASAPRSGSLLPLWLRAVLAIGLGAGLAIGLLLLILSFVN